MKRLIVWVDVDNEERARRLLGKTLSALGLDYTILPTADEVSKPGNQK